ncbi:MAG: helix-turn-helix transcriptional regulator [Verrucomicrobiota bacterium]
MDSESRGCAKVAQLLSAHLAISSVQKAHRTSQQPAGERNVIGQRIRSARQKCKPRVSQEDLAARLAVRGVYFDRSAISRMEAGLRFIRDYEIAAIADALGVSIESLFAKGKISKNTNSHK